jgi:hypothetical protein
MLTFNSQKVQETKERKVYLEEAQLENAKLQNFDFIDYGASF